MALKTPTYQRSVGLKPTNNAQLQYNNAGTMAAANGAQAMNNMTKAFDSWAQVREKQIDEDMTNAVIAAQTEYKRLINDSIDNNDYGLKNFTGERAKDVDQEFMKRKEQIRKNVMKTLPRYAKAEQAFARLADEYDNTKMESIVTFQGKEREKQENLTFSNAVEAGFNDIRYDDVNSIKNCISGMERLAYIYPYRKNGEEGAKAFMTGVKKNLAHIMLNQANDAKDWDAVERILKEESKYLDPLEASRIKAGVSAEREKDLVYTTADKYIKINKAKYTKADGSFDTEAAIADYDQSVENDVETITIVEGGNRTEFNIPLSEADSPDVDGLKPELKSSLGSIGGMINELGLSDGALITSGNRDDARNAAAGGAPNSWHKSGDAIDIYFPNLSQDQQNKLVEKFNPYFGEVLYHDAGTGYHLHLGNYHGGLNESTNKTITRPKKRNRETEDKIKQLIRAHGAEVRQNIAIRNSDEMDRVKNGLVELKGSPTAQFDLIDNSALSLYVKAELRGRLEDELKPKPLQESDFGAKALLLKMKADGTLTEQDVLNQMKFLTTNDALSFLTASYDIGAKRNDKASNIADKKWQTYLDANGPYKNDKNKLSQLTVEISDILDTRNVTGDERRVEAMKLINEENQNSETNPILKYTIRNNEKKQQLIDAFGETSVRLAEEGLKRSGDWSGNYDDINVYLSAIGAQIQNGDSIAEEAYYFLQNNNIAINPATFNDAYETIKNDRMARGESLW